MERISIFRRENKHEKQGSMIFFYIHKKHEEKKVLR